MDKWKLSGITKKGLSRRLFSQEVFCEGCEKSQIVCQCLRHLRGAYQWFAGRTRRFDTGGWFKSYLLSAKASARYGCTPKVLIQLEITDEAGNVTVVGSDETWDWSNDGPVRRL